MQFDASSRERFDDHPVGITCRAVHQIDSLIAFGESGVFPSTGEIKAQTRQWLPSRFNFRALYMRVKIEIDRRAIDNLGDLIIFVIVVEDIAVQRQRAVQQSILASQLERIDEFGFERQRVIRIFDVPPTGIAVSTRPGGFAPPAL